MWDWLPGDTLVAVLLVIVIPLMITWDIHLIVETYKRWKDHKCEK